ncbi:ankyrin repeat family protein [Tanacetum coccineum]
MEPQLGLYVRLGEMLGLGYPTIGIRARLGPVVVWMVFPRLDPGSTVLVDPGKPCTERKPVKGGVFRCFYGETSLHLAVGEFKDIEVAKDILKGIKPDLLETMYDSHGMNPAHHAAALVGNTEALKIMVDYNPKCLHIRDQKDYLPIDVPIKNNSFGSTRTDTTADIENQVTTRRNMFVTPSHEEMPLRWLTFE